MQVLNRKFENDLIRSILEMLIVKLFKSYGNLLKTHPIPTQAFQTGRLSQYFKISILCSFLRRAQTYSLGATLLKNKSVRTYSLVVQTNQIMLEWHSFRGSFLNISQQLWRYQVGMQGNNLGFGKHCQFYNLCFSID